MKLWRNEILKKASAASKNLLAVNTAIKTPSGIKPMDKTVEFLMLSFLQILTYFFYSKFTFLHNHKNVLPYNLSLCFK